RRGAQGCPQAAPVQALRHRVHAGAAGRGADGVVGGKLRGLLQLRPPPRPRGPGARDPMITLSPPLAFTDARIDMAHGAGGKASRRLVEGLIAPLVGACGPLGDAAAMDVDGARIALTTDSFVVRPLRSPGSTLRD